MSSLRVSSSLKRASASRRPTRVRDSSARYSDAVRLRLARLWRVHFARLRRWPLSNWVAACDLMLGMDIDTVVPGHGPLTDKGGIAQVRDYLAFVDSEASARQAAGVDAWDAAREIAREIGARPEFGSWGEFGRIAVNVETVYRSLDPDHRTPDVVEQFRRMATIEQAATA